jgi:predicted DsbA family dithiol-disulfide isomerase
MPREAYFPPGRLRQAEEVVRTMAAEVGLTMRHLERMVNSRLALSTAEFARDRAAFEPVHHALFRLHWEGPGALDDVAELRRVVEEAGLDGAELEAALAEGRYEARLDDVRRQALEVGIEAVPAHVFGRRYLVIGAQPDEVYDQVLRRLDETSG